MENSSLGSAPRAEFDDIEWRVDSAPYPRGNGHVARFVPYLKAHSVARMLDEWVGVDGWSDRYVVVGKALECHLTVGDVTKVDAGVSPGGDDNMAVKGTYSDAFKRCASIKWGVGRNVYALEGVWAPVDVKTRGDKETARENDLSLKVIRERYDEMTAL